MDNDERLNRLIAHHESITSKWVQYHKMYMQSWTIFGSAIVAGALFTQGKGEGDGWGADTLNVQSLLLLLLPLFILIWFLLTSHFWAMSSMFSKYSESLEAQIRREFHAEVAFRMYSRGEGYWYLDSPVANYVTGFVGLLCFGGYLLIAGIASNVIEPGLNWSSGTIFAGYCMLGAVAGALIWKFIHPKRQRS